MMSYLNIKLLSKCFSASTHNEIVIPSIAKILIFENKEPISEMIYTLTAISADQ